MALVDSWPVAPGPGHSGVVLCRGAKRPYSVWTILYWLIWNGFGLAAFYRLAGASSFLIGWYDPQVPFHKIEGDSTTAQPVWWRRSITVSMQDSVPTLQLGAAHRQYRNMYLPRLPRSLRRLTLDSVIAVRPLQLTHG